MHDDVIKWKHFPRYWPFVRGIHRSPVNSPHKGQWRRALMFSLNCVWINGWVNNREAGDVRRYRVHDVIVIKMGRVINGIALYLLFLLVKSTALYCLWPPIPINGPSCPIRRRFICPLVGFHGKRINCVYWSNLSSMLFTTECFQ